MGQEGRVLVCCLGARGQGKGASKPVEGVPEKRERLNSRRKQARVLMRERGSEWDKKKLEEKEEG